MIIDIRTNPGKKGSVVAEKPSTQSRITVFHCFNALSEVSFPDNSDYELQAIKLPCSGLTREVVLLKAFEGGADAVVVLVCPENTCHYVQGNLRAAKRVARVKKILDEIGIDGRRLNLCHIPEGDQDAANRIIDDTLMELQKIGLSPAR